MLSVTGLNQFYYFPDFTDMRCKHGRVLSLIRESLHREPSDGDVFIVMSKDRQIIVKVCQRIKRPLYSLSSRTEPGACPDTEKRKLRKAALNYLDRFWDEIFAYLQDGTLPIDNNLAERTIRKLTTQRNNSLHYGSDAGVEMAAAYHSVISTVKLHGSSVRNFIGTFFTKIFNGCRDYVNMTPDKIHLATIPC